MSAHKESHEDGAFALDKSLDLIDINTLEFDDQEHWLLESNEMAGGSGVNNIRIWLKAHTDADDSLSLSANKKLIDTRTWTRPKKRFSRLSFETILQSPPQPLNNVWQTNTGVSSVSRGVDINISEEIQTTPSIFQVSRPGINFTGCSTGQESLEAFVNMSETGSVDSFINMEAPEFNESLITSITSQPTTCSTTYAANEKSLMEDSNILTNSMMQTSMFNDTFDLNTNDPFARDNGNTSVIENPNYCSPQERTVTKVNDTFDCVTSSNTTINLQHSNTSSNATFTTEYPTSPLNSLNSTTTIGNTTFTADSSCGSNRRSYIIIKDNENCESELETVGECYEDNLNVTYAAPSSPIELLDPSINGQLNAENDFCLEEDELNATYLTNENQVPQSVQMNTTIEVPQDITKVLPSRMKSPLSTHNQQTPLNSTFVSEVKPISRHLTFKKSRPEMVKPALDSTYNQEFVDPNVIPVNRFHTFRKNVGRSQLKSINTTENCTTIESQAKSLDNLSETRNIQSTIKQIVPKKLSRLPQSLQKSNPNLTSCVLKLSNTTQSTFGFNRQKFIGNGDPSLRSKLYSLSKLRTGSEQRLDGPSVASEYFETGGSTESIESTQSTHSAPDLDDRLSVCSDSSQNSYGKRTIDIHRGKNERGIMENTWVSEEGNLPSPILKNSETTSSFGSSPGSGDPNVKTSSPIISPGNSPPPNNMNAGRHIVEQKSTDQSEDKKMGTYVKPLKTVETKSGLRQPINRAMSGIPRPASRIPPPGFSRTGLKSHTEVKRNIA